MEVNRPELRRCPHCGLLHLTLFRHMALPGKIGNPFADKSRQPKTEIEQQMEAFVLAAAKRVYA